MLNNMVASFTASNQVGEAMKKASRNKDIQDRKNIQERRDPDYPRDEYPDNETDKPL